MLKKVLTPISRLGPRTFFIELWNTGANMKPTPLDDRQLSTSSRPRSTGSPSADKTSADPHLLDTDLLPCFATVTPAPATTKDAAVLMLNELEPSPPVPQRSTVPSGALTLVASSRIAMTNPLSSCSVSPLILMA